MNQILNLSTAQRMLLGIIESVESGVTTPEQAVEELETLKKKTSPRFKAQYTLDDFKKMVSYNEANYEASYEASYEVSY